MNKQTPSDEELDIIKAGRVLNRSMNYKRLAKRERMIQRLRTKSLIPKTRKPKRKDREEIVARQKKFRAPYGAEG